MPVTATCRCGGSFALKDEYAGKRVKCPKCGETVQVGAAEAPRPKAGGVFDRDRYLLRQKHLAISEKYEVWDEDGNAILYVERPAHLLRNLGAAFAGIASAGAFAAAFGAAAAAAPEGPAQGVLGLVAGLGAFVVLILVAVALSRKRHVTFYSDPSKTEPLLEIFQDRKVQIIHARYTVKVPGGDVLAFLDKNYIYNIFRKRWYCRAPDGPMLCVAKEDSLILSLLRRWLGPLFGFLRTNFVIMDPASGDVIGEFNRKFTILDRYVLDMSADPDRALDRRIALALGVMLDTGERR
jgi:hypothetical protein